MTERSKFSRSLFTYYFSCNCWKILPLNVPFMHNDLFWSLDLVPCVRTKVPSSCLLAHVSLQSIPVETVVTTYKLIDASQSWFPWKGCHFCVFVLLLPLRLHLLLLTARMFFFHSLTNLCSLLKVHKIVLYNWFKVCALSLDENIKKKYKFLCFGLRMYHWNVFLALSLSLLLHLSCSDKIDIFNIDTCRWKSNQWKSTKIEL